MWKIYLVPCDSTLNKLYCIWPHGKPILYENKPEHQARGIGACFMLVACMSSSLTFKMETTHSSKKSVDF
jgi:hypothetical protein